MRLPTALLLAALALAWALASDAKNTTKSAVVPLDTSRPWVMVDKWRKDEYKATGRFPTRCKHCIKPPPNTDPNLN